MLTDPHDSNIYSLLIRKGHYLVTLFSNMRYICHHDWPPGTIARWHVLTLPPVDAAACREGGLWRASKGVGSHNFFRSPRETLDGGSAKKVDGGGGRETAGDHGENPTVPPQDFSPFRCMCACIREGDLCTVSKVMIENIIVCLATLLLGYQQTLI